MIWTHEHQWDGQKSSFCWCQPDDTSACRKSWRSLNTQSVTEMTKHQKYVVFYKIPSAILNNAFILFNNHYSDVIMSVKASQITSLTIVYSTVYSGADQRKHQNSASLAFVWGIHWWPVNSLHKWLAMWKMIPFDDVIMMYCRYHCAS